MVKDKSCDWLIIARSGGYSLHTHFTYTGTDEMYTVERVESSFV